MKFIEYLTKVIAWFQIAVSPAAIGLIAGFFIYRGIPGPFGFFSGIAVAALGVVGGMVWATRVWIKRGTVDHLSKVIGTPELDNKDDK